MFFVVQAQVTECLRAKVLFLNQILHVDLRVRIKDLTPAVVEAYQGGWMSFLGTRTSGNALFIYMYLYSHRRFG
jgi:hypothetical protein